MPLFVGMRERFIEELKTLLHLRFAASGILSPVLTIEGHIVLFRSRGSSSELHEYFKRNSLRTLQLCFIRGARETRLKAFQFPLKS